MTFAHRLAIASSAFASLASLVRADDGPAEQAYPLATLGTLVIQLPDRWRDISVVGEPGGRTPSMLEFLSKDASGKVDFKLLPIVPPMLRPEMTTDAGLKKLCETSARKYLATSVEKTLTLLPLDGPATHGFFYTLTDASRDAGDYRCISGGAFRVGGAVLSVTLMHQPDQPAFAAAIELVRTATVRSATTAPASQPAGLSMTSPDGAWCLSLPNPGCGEALGMPAGPSVEYSASGAVTLSAFFEPAARPTASASAVRAFYLSRMRQSGAPLERVTLGGDDRVALLHYSMLGQANAHAYLAHGGAWVDLHLSCDPTDAASIKRIEAALAKIKVDEVAKQ